MLRRRFFFFWAGGATLTGSGAAGAGTIGASAMRAVAAAAGSDADSGERTEGGVLGTTRGWERAGEATTAASAAGTAALAPLDGGMTGFVVAPDFSSFRLDLLDGLR